MDAALRAVLQDHQQQHLDIVDKIDQLAKLHGEEIYQALFNYLFGRSFETELAAHYWHEALVRWQHQKELRPGFLQVKAALLDYLEDVAGEKLGSATDGLTGLFNSNYFRLQIDREIAHIKHRQAGEQLTIVQLAMDRYPELRQQYPQTILAQMQRHLARLVKNRALDIDTAARLGDGQFALLLVNNNHNEAFAAAERIRNAVLSERWQRLPEPQEFPTTISCGIANYPNDGQNANVLCRVSRRHLLQAQQLGNRCEPTKSERRRLGRNSLSSYLEIARLGDTCFHPALCRDVSLNGIALECELNPGCGTSLQLRFKRPFWPIDREFSGTIRRAEKQEPSGIFRLALEFGQSEHLLLAQHH